MTETHFVPKLMALTSDSGTESRNPKQASKCLFIVRDCRVFTSAASHIAAALWASIFLVSW
jgi:hypothetical protein